VLGGDQQAFAGTVVTATLPGLRLFFFGQFQGFKNKLDVHLRRAVSESSNSTVQTLYNQLTNIISVKSGACVLRFPRCFPTTPTPHMFSTFGPRAPTPHPSHAPAHRQRVPPRHIHLHLH
jgi:hypothetical protein